MPAGFAARYERDAHHVKNPPLWGGLCIAQGIARRDHAACDANQKRVRMPIVPTIWFGVLDAPPEPLMNA